MIIHIITNMANGGAERMLSRLLDTTTDPVLIVSLMDVSERYRNSARENVRFLPLKCYSPLRAASSIATLSRVIAREKPTVILCWMYHAMIAGSLAGHLSGNRVPIYWTVRQSLDDRGSFSRNTRWAANVARYLSQWPEGIIFNSARSLDLHRQHGYRNDNVIVIPNGVEPAELRATIIDKVPRVIGLAARLHPQKDHKTFFQAAALTVRRLPGARFMAAGRDVTFENPEVRHMIDEAGLPLENIELLGEVDDMDAFYRQVDILALSSRTEGFPNVVVEAMNHGKPVVSTDVGDVAAIIGETGTVVPAKDPGALAQGMVNMLSLSQVEYSARSAAAADRIRAHFSLQNSAKQYREFLERRLTSTIAVEPQDHDHDGAKNFFS